MKKIVILILLICSTAYSEESISFYQVNTKFTSGIKQIYIYQLEDAYSHLSPNPFLILTDDDSLFFFEDVYYSGRPVELPDVKKITDIALGYYHDEMNIFIVADTKLYYSKDKGVKWEIAQYQGNEIFQIIDMAISGDGFTGINLITDDSLFYHCDSKNNWYKYTDGLDKIKLKHLFVFYDNYFGGYHIYGLSTNNELLLTSYPEYEWHREDIFDTNQNIIEMRLSGHSVASFYYLNNRNEMYSTNIMFEQYIEDSIKITCFTAATWFHLLFLSKSGIYPFDIMYGTEENGLFIFGYRHINGYENIKLGNEFDNKKITDIETNARKEPNLCLIGTDEGELYFGRWTILKVTNNKSGSIDISLSPNPATDYIEINLDNVETGLRPVSEEIEIFDVLGQSVGRNTPSSLSDDTPLLEGNKRMNISHLQSGIYFIKFGDEFLKFVKL